MKYFKLTVLCALMAALMFSCDKTRPEPTNSPGLLLKLTAEFRAPLFSITDNVAEGEILDSKQVQQENVDRLKPVLNQILVDAMAGKIQSHGFAYEQFPETENKLSSEWNKIMNQAPFDLAYLNRNVEVIMTASRDGQSVSLQPEWLRIVWCDVEQILPDRHVARIPVALLSAYTIETESGTVSLPDYLKHQSYADYLISINHGEEFAAIRNYADALPFEELVRKGQFEEALDFDDRYKQQ